MKFYYVTNIFDLHIFDNEMTALLKFFKICTEMHFVSLFFLSERYITTSLLMIRQCTVVHFANVKLSSINKSFLDCEPLNMLFRFFLVFFRFFLFLVCSYFKKAFVKEFIKKLIIFNTSFQN